MQPIVERPLWRCKGPWPACGHADNTCTACPAYQARIEESFRLPDHATCPTCGAALAPDPAVK